MSDITPYINQQSWGTDLLKKLLTLINLEMGGLHLWDVTPSVWIDGQPLGVEHSGYTGINTSNQPRVEKWDGSKWETVFKVPIESVGELVSYYQKEYLSNGMIGCYVNSIFDDFIYIIKNDADGLVSVSKIVKETGTTQWTSSAALLSPNLYAPITPTSFCFCVHNSQAFFITRQLADKSSSTSAAGSYRIFAFSELSGALLWFQDISVILNTYVLNIITNNNNEILIFIGNFLTSSLRIVVVNTNNGAIKSDTTLSLAFSPYDIFAQYDIVTNSYILVYGKSYVSDNPVVISKLSADLTTVVNSLTIGNSQTVIHQGLGVFDPDNTSLVYFIKNPGNKTSEFYVYNHATQSSQFLGAINYEIFGSLYAVFYEEDERVFVVNNNAILLGYKVGPSNNAFLYDTYVPSQRGDILVPHKKIGFDSNQELVRFVISETGHASVKKQSLQIFISKPQNQISFFQGSYFSSSPKFEEVRQEFNFPSGFIQDFKTSKSKTSSLTVSPVKPPTTPIDQVPRHPVLGVVSENIFGGYHLFSGGISNESQSYSASNASRVSGLLMGCQNIGGRILHSYELDGAAAIVFDSLLRRLFLCCNGAQPLTNGIISGFPNSNGIVINDANNIGIGMYAPAYKLDVNGTARATTLMNSGGIVTSDERIKVGILALDGASLWEICEELEAISFLYKPDFSVEIRENTKDENGEDAVTTTTQYWSLPQGIQYGWSAQKIRELLPELVTEDPQSGVLYLNREALFPIFQSAATTKIKQLEESIAQKDTLLTQLQSALESLTTRVEALENAAA